MKVVSFKVDDCVYDALKKRKQSFRSLFEPYALELSQNTSNETKYTGGIRTFSPELYIDLSLLQKTLEKILRNNKGG